MEYEDNGAWSSLARTQEAQEEVVERTITQPHKLINKEKSQFSLTPLLLLRLQLNQGLYKWAANQDIANG